jgi:hypothetical protein
MAEPAEAVDAVDISRWDLRGKTMDFPQTANNPSIILPIIPPVPPISLPK